MSLISRLRALREAVPELMRRCVADVSDEKPTKNAFAICNASLHKSGRLKTGSVKLTKKGKAVSRGKAKQRGAVAKHRKYVKALKQEMRVVAEVYSDFARNAGFADTVVSMPEPSASRRIVQQFEPVANEFGKYLSTRTGMHWEFDKNIGADGPGKVEFAFVLVGKDTMNSPHFTYGVDFDSQEDLYTLTTKIVNAKGKTLRVAKLKRQPMDVIWKPETAFDGVLASV